MQLYIVRHGQSLAQTKEDKGVDPHLSTKGLLQAEALGDRFADIHFDFIYASHQSRALQTAVGVAKKQAGKPLITVVPELAECGVNPIWDCDVEFHKSVYDNIAYTKTRLENLYANDIERSLAALKICVFPHAYENGFTEITDSNEGPVKSNDVNVLIAAHGMYDAYLLSHLVKFPFDVNMVVEQHNTCVNHLSLYTVNDVRRVKFVSFNDYHHLSSEIV